MTSKSTNSPSTQDEKIPTQSTWNGLKITFDKKQGILTIFDGAIHNEDGKLDLGFHIAGDVKEIRFNGNVKIYGSAHGLFNGLNRLTSIKGLDKLDTSDVTDMSNMFSFCGELIDLDLSSFNTAKVTNMTSMFQSCKALQKLDISNFDMKNVPVDSLDWENKDKNKTINML
ncbi:MAG: BspA family leucine-rich repeat surface protein, partial [Lactobacillus sp.]|nr:BspA family leucine-rich repeat surface protein [Lactobacillus sp.]